MNLQLAKSGCLLNIVCVVMALKMFSNRRKNLFTEMVLYICFYKMISDGAKQF